MHRSLWNIHPLIIRICLSFTRLFCRMPLWKCSNRKCKFKCVNPFLHSSCPHYVAIYSYICIVVPCPAKICTVLSCRDEPEQKLARHGQTSALGEVNRLCNPCMQVIFECFHEQHAWLNNKAVNVTIVKLPDCYLNGQIIYLSFICFWQCVLSLLFRAIY